MNAHTATAARTARVGAAPASRVPVRAPSTVATTALLGSILLVVAIGIWGILAIGGGHDGHPRAGDVVTFEGGTLVVEAARDVDLSLPMTGPAMKMGPSSGVPEVPDGYRWLSVDLSIEAPDGYRVDADRFLVAVDGDGSGPVDVDEGGSVIPPGAWLARSFTYQVPEDAHELEFWAPGAEVPVMLTLGDAPESHQH